MPLKTDVKRAGFSTSLGQKLVFFGNESLATGIECDGQILQSLIDYGHIIEAVILRGSGPAKTEWAVERIAKQHNIPTIWVSTKEELQQTTMHLQSEIAVLASFGMIIPSSVLDAFTFGIINVHPSLLPVYRGSSPIEQALLDGKKETGVSIMQLNSKMDEGPLFLQETIQIDDTTTKQQLYEKVVAVAVDILPNALVDIVSGSLRPFQQTGTPSYTPLISKHDGKVSTDEPAEFIVKKIKAYSGWPKVKMTINDIPCAILDARANETASLPVTTPIYEDGIIKINTEEGVLEILSLQPDGKKPMAAKDFANGYL
ncbi:TPA: hypothetical protein EYO12_00060 [Candidatus Saccharibacteria bacterium]|nr:hypothetical protein [Candidatus Saccharibacteria bacterium]HIO87190.1 hypothetical protein [Candidatus Saccharibacteria bacterium]